MCKARIGKLFFLFLMCAAPMSIATAANYYITTGMTLAQINAVIAGASAGDTIYVQPGTYTITGKINMKAGIIMRNYTSNKPVFDARSGRTELLEMYYSGTTLSNCQLIGIQYYNIRIKTTCTNVKFDGCVFDYGKRKPGTDKAYLNDAYIHFAQATSPIVTNCQFWRRSGASGRGVYNNGSSNAQFTNNTFGDGSTKGYFVTAFNELGTGTHITGNTIRKNPSWDVAAESDHGIYAQGFNNLVISGNTISGWSPSGHGGAIKARNADGLTISNNTMSYSGILLYVYASGSQLYLKNVQILNNTINIYSTASDIYHGIGYYKDTPDGVEYSIRIYGNIMGNGTIKIDQSSINTANFNANGGGVFNNDIRTLLLKSGINNSGNY